MSFRLYIVNWLKENDLCTLTQYLEREKKIEWVCDTYDRLTMSYEERDKNILKYWINVKKMLRYLNRRALALKKKINNIRAID